MFKVTILTTKERSMKRFDSTQNIPIPISGMPGLGTITATDGTVHTVSAYTLVGIAAVPVGIDESPILVELKD